MFTLFVDISKAFDTVDRQALWKVPGKFGCPSRFTNLIKSYHEGMKARVQPSGSTSGSFDAVSGVKQGCILVTALFNFYLTAILIVAFSDFDDGVRIEHHTDGGLLNIHRFGAKTKVYETMIRYLLHADDCALFAHMTTGFETASRKFGLRINVAKTVCLFQPAPGVSNLPDPDIMTDSLDVECSTDFCYFGSHVSTDLSVTREVRSRLSKAATAFGRLERRVGKNRHLKTRTKLAVYKSMVLSVLLYGSETWTLYKSYVNYLDRFHFQCLRRILGIRWSDKVPNTDVLLRASAQGMGSMLVLNQLRWVGHVSRMDN